MRATQGHAPLCPCCGAERVVSRRGFLAAAAIGAAVVAPGIHPALAQRSERVLRVRRHFTEDSFTGVYWRDGHYDREALRRLDFVFRDLSLAELTPMDPRLFDVMASVAEAVGVDEPYEVISGYRTPETNHANARRSRIVSTVSLHMSGMAADCRLPGRLTLEVARRAADLELGGVGLYRPDGFMHLDCGPVRRW